MPKDRFNGYKAWSDGNPERRPYEDDDSYAEEQPDELLIAEVVSGRIAAISALITAIKDERPWSTPMIRDLAEEAMKLAIEKAKPADDKAIDTKPEVTE